MPVPNTSTILSLAILKVNWEKGRDYLETFVPLVAECIRLSEHEIVTTQQLQEDIKTRFGLLIPQNSLKSILLRLKKHGLIRQENRIFYRNLNKISELKTKFHQVQQQVLGMYETLVNHYIRFCSEEFGVAPTEEDADAAFQGYLKEKELAIGGKDSPKTVIPQLAQPATKSTKFFVGSFVQHLETSHSTEFAHWETIVTGNMLANSVFLPDPAQPTRHFRNTSIFFDTSFLIYALGYAGEVRQAPSKELLELLYEVGASLKCFSHTVDEIRGILSACSYRIRAGRLRDAYGPTIEYFLQKDYSASDIELLSVRLEKDLKALRINVEDKPGYEEHAYVIDEEGLKNCLSSAISYREPNGIAVSRDVDSISGIMRLRRGRQTDIVEECLAVFISTNLELARLTRQFCFEESFPYAVAPCLTDYTLTNMLWLKRPLQAPDLPRKRIIADYYAAIQPDEQLLREYYAEIEKLMQDKRITTDDYYLLRYSLESKYGLMQATNGGENPITEITVKEALEYVQDRLTADDRQKLQSQMRLTELAQEEVESLRGAEIERSSRIRLRAQRSAKLIVAGMRFMILLLLVAATIYTFPWELPTIRSHVFGYMRTLALIALLIISVVSLMFGTSIEPYIRRFEVCLSRRIDSALHSLTD